MPRKSSKTDIYRRGPFWLNWDKTRAGTLRSPYLQIFWYDQNRRRNRSASTGTGDVAEAKAALDRHYLARTEGSSICPSCGQRRQSSSDFLLIQAIQNYLSVRLQADDAIAYRLAHITAFLTDSDQVELTCRQANEEWASRFRSWAMQRPIISPRGKARPRSLSTIENSLIQLAAAVNAAHKRGDTPAPAQFKPIPTTQLNRTPTYRSNVAELGAMFRYATEPKYLAKRAALHRYLMAAVGTVARPSEVHDISTAPARAQWHGDVGTLNLNPRGRRQTRKYRSTIPVPRQLAAQLTIAPLGHFVGAASVKSAWNAMAAHLGLPREGAGGMKLIRRSMAKLLRDRLPKSDWPEIEMLLGHRRLDPTTSIYAPFDPGYLGAARAELERIIEEIIAIAPNAFRRTNTGQCEPEQLHHELKSPPSH